MRAAGSLGAPVGRRWRRPTGGELLALGLIVAAGAAVRFVGLGHQSFDSGETVTAARILHPSYLATFDALATIERSGPLYYTLAWGWAQLFGTAEAALRSLSALFGVATILIAFLTAREVFSRRAALIAAALVAACPDLIWYSQEARSYALFIMLGAAALYFFVRAIRRPSRGALIGWAACSALALSTHYFSVFAIAPEACLLVWAGRGRPRPRLVAVGSVGLVGLALLPLAIHQEGAGRANSFTSIPVLERAGSSLVKYMSGEGPTTAGVWSTLPETFRVAGILALGLVAASLLVLLVRGGSDERRGAALVGGIGAFAFLVPLALALAGIDYIEPRNLLGSLVPLLIVAAAGIDVAVSSPAAPRAQAGTRLAAVAAPVCVFAAVIAATSLSPSLERDNWRRLGSLVADAPHAGVILADPASAAKPLHYFLGRPLAPLDAARYPCGVRSRTLVTVSRRRPRPDPASGFRLASSRRSRGWLVDSFRAPSAEPLDGADLRDFGILGPRAVARIDNAPPVSASWDERRALLASVSDGWDRGRPEAFSDRSVHAALTATSTRPLAGWPPPRCALGTPASRTVTASSASARALARASRPAPGRRRAA